MTIQLKGIQIELPNNAKVDVSEDGKTVKVSMPETQVIEKIRVVGEPKVIERIKVVEKNVPCPLNHYPFYCTQPHPCDKPHYYPTYPSQPWITWSTSGGTLQGGNTTICNSGGIQGVANNHISCKSTH